jgi:hypothetical protein
MYGGEGRFAAGMHIDEGRLMGLNGCAKGCNTWYFISDVSDLQIHFSIELRFSGEMLMCGCRRRLQNLRKRLIAFCKIAHVCG